MKKESEIGEPRRQARGQKRIAQLLKAAGEVFQESGYEGATTNAIAARAGVSPGTLYQFFSNKQALAQALANEYARQRLAVHEDAFAHDSRELPLKELIDRLVDPFLAFRRSAPGFEALFTGSVVSRELADSVHALHGQLEERIAELVRKRVPHMSEDRVKVCAATSVQIVKGLLPLSLKGTQKQREAAACELKLVLERYLAPLNEIEHGSKPGKPAARKTKSIGHSN
jgi:AcrR family transcriptional regulator